MAKAWYSGSVKEFRDADVDSVFANIVRNSVFDVNTMTKESWDEEIKFLKDLLAEERYDDGYIVLEYPIPQLRGRIDAVLLYAGTVFVLEFKTGMADKNFASEAKRQVSHYALDLKYFHLASRNLKIVPILICPKAKAKACGAEDLYENVLGCRCCKTERDVANVIERDRDTGGRHIDGATWLNSMHSPVPTIIDAARALFAQKDIEDITKTSDNADSKNLKETIKRINEIIDETKKRPERKSRAICFVTGVPGAGKTLVGLDVAIDRHRYEIDPTKGSVNDAIVRKTDKDEKAVFLSGNGPLVAVLQAALKKDAAINRNAKLKDLKMSEKRKATYQDLPKITREYLDLALEKTFVKDVYGFRMDWFDDKPPSYQIAIFDEAQRAWTEDHLVKKMGKHMHGRKKQSEPACLIDQMDKLESWAVIVCLVGGGQEIHDGEAGISAWLEALKCKKDWHVYISDYMKSNPQQFAVDRRVMLADGTVELRGTSDELKKLYDELGKDTKRWHEDDKLHLKVNNRSIRSNRVSDFVDYLVRGQSDKIAQSGVLDKEKGILGDNEADVFPVFLTQDFEKAKQWVANKAARVDGRPIERYGILATSTEQRLRADGVVVPKDMNVVDWMLGEPENVDSSYQMEIAASEFKVQGLEIDYAVVVWGGDYQYIKDAKEIKGKKNKSALDEGGHFLCRGYRGAKRTLCTDPTQKVYLRNAYRVLLTRARQGMIIYVPKGDKKDNTRMPKFYEDTYNYLHDEVGIRDLDDVAWQARKSRAK